MPPAGFESTIPANGRQQTTPYTTWPFEIGTFKARIDAIRSCVLGMISHVLQGKNSHNIGAECLKLRHAFSGILHLFCMGFYLVKFEISHLITYLNFNIIFNFNFIPIIMPDNS